MPEINYCQNLWEQFERVKAAQLGCAEILNRRFTDDILASLNGRLEDFQQTLRGLDEVWENSFAIISGGRRLFGPEYEAIKRIEQIIGYDPIEPNSIFNRDAIEDGHIIKLTLFGAPIKDISSLGHLVALRELSLLRTPVKDITPLKNLVNLQKLDLGAGWQSGYLDISPLKNLINLRELGIHDETPITGFSVMATLTGLRTIKFKYRAEYNFSAIMNLPNLTTLHLGKHPFDIPNYGQIKALRERGVHVWFD